MSELCPFCEIAAGRAPAQWVVPPDHWPDAIAFVPLDPVVDGHVLVVPKLHVTDWVDDPDVTGVTAKRSAQLGKALDLVAANLITSMGPEATQTVFRLHLHLVPRTHADGLALPWDGIRIPARAA